MAKKQWVKFTKHGAGAGLGYFAGSVAELDDDKAKKAMQAGLCLPAEPEEITKAQEAFAAETLAKESAAKKSAAKGPIDPVAFFDLLQKQSEQIAALSAQVAELQNVKAAAKPAGNPDAKTEGKK